VSHTRTIIALAFLLIAGLLFFLPEREHKQYFHNKGFIFGTYYSVQYEAEKDLHDSLLLTLEEVDEALSMFNANSVLSRVNRNEDVEISPDFEEVFLTAQRVSELSHGAFDITVAPLVNAWGFGFQNKQQMTEEKVDSLRQLVDYKGITLANHHIHKRDARQMIDAGAVAKGFGCDKAARFLRRHGVENLLVDIGGEVVAQGRNSKGEAWTIGITKPVDDVTGVKQELQDIVHTTSICMASSGNYRNFYYYNGVRRSHTIDPRTGYPVHHSLLSATVTASSCMLADALATCCMVVGADSALVIINSVPEAECYLVEASADTLAVRTSKGWKQ
jgi:thiamine biosynthesis lipoprotein